MYKHSAEYFRAWRAAHPEYRERERIRKSAPEALKHAREVAAKYRAKNTERIQKLSRKRSRRYYAKNRDMVLERARAKYAMRKRLNVRATKPKGSRHQNV